MADEELDEGTELEQDDVATEEVVDEVEGGEEVAEVEAAEEPVAEAPPSSPLFDKFKQYGWDASQQFKTEDEALIHFMNMQKQLPHLQQLAQVGQQYLPHRRRIDAYLDELQNGPSGRQYEQAPPQPAAPAPPKPWKHPTVDMDVAREYIARDENGNYVRDHAGNYQLREDTPPEIIKGVSDYRRSVANHKKRVDEDLEGYISEMGYARKEDVINEVREMLSSEFGYREQANTVYGIVQQLNGMMRDEHGNLTEFGVHYPQYVSEIEQMGVADPTQVAELAMAKWEAEQWRRSQHQAQQTQQTTRVVAGVPPAVAKPVSKPTTPQLSRKPNRKGSASPRDEAPVSGKGLSLREMFKADGVSFK